MAEWTIEIPKKPGWYWYRNSIAGTYGVRELYRVEPSHGLNGYMIFGENDRQYGETVSTGEWWPVPLIVPDTNT